MKMLPVLLAIAAALVLCVAGCGASALQTHTASAIVVKDALNVSGELILDDMHKKVTDAASDESVDTATAELNAHNIIRSYNPAIKLHEHAVTAWQLWVTSLLSSYKDDVDDADAWRTLAATTFKAYKDMATQALRHNLKLPSILDTMQTTLKAR